MSDGDESEGELGPEELMGLAGLLRAWRTAAGFKLGRGKPLTKAEVAYSTGMSEKWYRELERGAVPRISPDFVEKLAEVLALSPDEKQTLYYYTPGGTLIARAASSKGPPAQHTLQFMLDLVLPNPAYLSDVTWNVVGYNRAMADWFPWAAEPGANLMRWALLDPDAREQYLGWEEHARTYLAMIRMELVRRPGDRELTALLREAYEDPDCRRLWDESPRVVAHRDSNHFRLRLPRFDRQEIEVVSHVGFPASYPDLRTVVITWLGSEAEPSPHLDGFLRTALPAGEGHQHPTTTALLPGGPGGQGGDGVVALPALSARAGPGCVLTLRPDTGAVHWTSGSDEGGWRSNELSVEAVLARLVPDPGDRAAVQEYQELLRCTLPSDSSAAVAVLDAKISDLAARLDLAQELRGRLDPPLGG